MSDEVQPTQTSKYTDSNGRKIVFQVFQPGGYSLDRKWLHITGAISKPKEDMTLVDARTSVTRHHAIHSLLCMDRRYKAYRAQHHVDASADEIPEDMQGLIAVSAFSEEVDGDRLMGGETLSIKLGVPVDLYCKIKLFCDHTLWYGLRDFATLGNDVQPGDPADVFLKTTESPYDVSMPPLGPDARDSRACKEMSGTYSITNLYLHCEQHQQQQEQRVQQVTFNPVMPGTRAPLTNMRQMFTRPNPFAFKNVSSTTTTTNVFVANPDPDPTNPFYIPPPTEEQSEPTAPPAKQTPEERGEVGLA